MLSLIKQMYWKLIPWQRRQYIRNQIVEVRYGKLIREAINERIEHSDSDTKAEFKRIKERIERKPIAVYNYDFCDKYDIDEYVKKIKYDSERKIFYGYYHGKKLYISRLYNTIQTAAQCLADICMEQDIESPHRYISENYFLTAGECLLDIGSADGFFALDYVDNFNHIYIFENDPLWIEALHYTFEPYADRVEIVKKYVSDKTNEKEISIDDFLRKFDTLGSVAIKVDVEGAEEKVLRGCMETFARAEEITLYAATYHKPDDAEMVLRYVSGFEYEYSKGYMINLWGKVSHKDTIFRKGIIRARKGVPDVKEDGQL